MKTKLFSLVVPLALLGTMPGQAATVIGGSDLFTPAGLAQVENWLDSAPGLTYSGPLAFTNVFDSTGGKTSYDFHSTVDGLGPTVVLMQVSLIDSTTTQIIGGFNPQGWSSIGNYNYTPTFADRTAFIFNLTTNDIRYQERASQNGQYQTFNGADYGPTFGGGHDLYSSTDLLSGYVNSYSYCANPNSPCYPGTNLLGQGDDVSYIATYFNISKIEVFTIGPDVSQTPLPAALPLFATGLGALGLLARHRKRKAQIATARSTSSWETHMRTSRATIIVLVITCAISALGFAVTSQKAHAATLIHEYTFNGDATDSVGSINGTLIGGATATGGVLSLDGVSGYVQLNAFAVPTGAFSITFGAKSSGQNACCFTELISQGFSGAPGFYIGTNPAGQIRLGDQFQFTGINFPYDGQFHSFVLTSGSAGTKFYIDSFLAFSSVAAIAAPTTGTTTRFGRQFDVAFGAEFFKGDLEDIRIYSGELTPTPLPATLPLFVTGLGALGLLARHRKRKPRHG